MSKARPLNKYTNPDEFMKAFDSISNSQVEQSQQSPQTTDEFMEAFDGISNSQVEQSQHSPQTTHPNHQERQTHTLPKKAASPQRSVSPASNTGSRNDDSRTSRQLKQRTNTRDDNNLGSLVAIPSSIKINRLGLDLYDCAAILNALPKKQ